MNLFTGLCVLMMGMTKGGIPVGPVVLPLLVLLRHGDADAARQAVAFMLPLLCCMDVIAVAVYRHHIEWYRLKALFLPAIAGITLASMLFVAKDGAIIAVSESALRIVIGGIGLLFVIYRATLGYVRRLLTTPSHRPGKYTSLSLGFVAGMTSTIAHAAGPVLQMYLLPQHLEKRRFAATNAAFFFVINAVKLVPFVLLGRIDTSVLAEGAVYIPLIPAGVLAGYGMVHILPPRIYVIVIYTALLVASISLIAKTLS